MKWTEQFARVERWHQRFAKIDSGFDHSEGASPSSDNYVDDVYAFFQNCYHLKDWILHDPAVPQSCKDAVEPHINGERPLRLCADLCNASKHLALTKRRRSDEDPRFGGKHYDLYLGGETDTLSIKFEILTTNAREDAFDLATRCLESWRQFLERWSLH